MFNQSAFSLSLGHDWLIIQHRIERIQHYSSSNTSQIIWIELQKTKLLFLSNGSQRWLTLWLVVSAECFRMSAHAFRTSSSQFLIISFTITTTCPIIERLFSTRARATVVLLRSISTPHNPSPWVPSRSNSESSAQQRVRREKGGEGSGKGWFIQGSRLPCLVPSLLFPDSFPQAHDPSQP